MSAEFLWPLALFPPPRGLHREEKIGETFDFAPGKMQTEPGNHGRIVIVSPNAEAVSGRFSGNPSVSVMTAPLRSSAVPAEAETIRHCARVFRRGMPSRIFLPRDHATALSLQHPRNCKMPSFMSLTVQSASSASGVLFCQWWSFSGLLRRNLSQVRSTV